ncbi:ADP-ribosylglycohydrolase family protein [Microlunatus soli]|uniref:ADP-ribosylglycohydrolase n=1 Tax=Microlunatus soli TaxID=630515 RepID=A0A1H1TYN6_9ACTN|nr:ADP-ribosylglycohydrolase family protein [Microlunatus soli]SDS65352.1 ADP-ribosylglycohydrolase [Microlunatus soli]
MSTAVDVLFGVLYGDCLGAPYEFHNGPVTSPIAVGPSVFGHPAGRGTDDTETTVAVAEGLIDASQDGRSTTTAIAERLLAWHRTSPPDVGGTTASGLDAFDHSGDPRSGAATEHSVANGSLMRSAPFAVMNGDGSELAVDSSRTTHAHPQVLGCVRAYVRMLQMIMNGAEPTAIQVGDLAEDDLDLHPELEPAEIPCPGIGFAPYALDLAVWSATAATDFSSGIETIIRRGGDTDTNGAICGAVLAARFGFPSELVSPLDAERVDELTHLGRRLAVLNADQLRP